MKKGLALLGAAALALAGSIAAQASLGGPTVSTAAILETKLPRTLGEFGFFRDPGAQIPAHGVIPYELNMPLYSDGAEKLRFVFVPEGEQAQAEANGDEVLDLPVGSALIKTFAFGEGADRRLVETRVLLHRAEGWLALPYKWNEDQSEARLVVAGARMPVTTPGGEEISYRIPNKNQCKECHGLEDAVVPIGPRPRNLSAAWLSAQVQNGKLAAMPSINDTLPRMANASEAALESAARAYLDVNCAHCHRPGATASNSGLDLRWQQEDATRIGIFKRPVAAGRGSGGHDFDIEPGHPERSIIAYRMGSTDPGVAMPELGKSTVDVKGLALIERWIAQMEAP